MRKAKPKKRLVLPDPKFNDQKVSKFVNHLMYDGKKTISYEIFYNALDIVKEKMSKEEKTPLEIWKQALDKAVIYKKMANRWMTDKEWNHYYGGFEVTEEKFSGVSMFVPQYAQIFTNNKFIRQMGWYYAAGYADMGW